MAENSGWPGRDAPNVYRTVTASTTLASGIGTTPSPARNACMLIFTCDDNASGAETAVFTGDDDEDVTVTIGVDSTYPPLFGNFKTVGALGTNVTCVAGWLKNPTD